MYTTGAFAGERGRFLPRNSREEGKLTVNSKPSEETFISVFSTSTDPAAISYAFSIMYRKLRFIYHMLFNNILFDNNRISVNQVAKAGIS